jgi:hypothetical protein
VNTVPDFREVGILAVVALRMLVVVALRMLAVVTTRGGLIEKRARSFERALFICERAPRI